MKWETWGDGDMYLSSIFLEGSSILDISNNLEFSMPHSPVITRDNERCAKRMIITSIIKVEKICNNY